ncbi:NnrS family protein [Prosthecodimorpha staleyi]|uniref:NnrS family protein n=1 Tax=Prosthecodimorpha staleyi TaxID=2840188 RepID=A0A947D7F5_9HYPH|nr:NnrS family protein [Prosthecodimorpha staleyi]MBT9292120.1 NnrS family protein [Prosthecodimorpha staleyi]
MSTAARARAYAGPAILSWGFRPFFVSAGFWAVLAMAIWLPLFDGRISLPTVFSAVDWHVHEMMFGFVPAVMAGFLLTAIPNWTGRLPVVGWPLGAMVSVWAAGRLAVLFSDWLGWAAAAAVDVAFLVALAGVAFREVWQGNNRRNLPVVGIVLLMACANLAFHLEARTGSASVSARAGLALIVLLIALIGGRIIPSFTGNWLTRQGMAVRPAPFGRFDKAVMAMAVIALSVWTVSPDGPVAGIAMTGAGIGHMVRLARWQGHRVLSDRLVLVLHVGYGFLAAGLLLAGLHGLAPAALPQAAGIHALGVGAIGTMTLAVMTRATLGHTGRPLAASAATQFLYAGIAVATVGRVAMACLDGNRTAFLLAAFAWLAAFGTFVWAYGRTLFRPRPES